MKKKKFILLILLVFLFTTIMVPVQKAEANAVSKVVSLAAKKAAKEVILSESVETFGSLALKKIPNSLADNYQKEVGKRLVCLDGGGKSCQKVVNIIDTDTLSSNQKSQLKDKIGDLLEVKIYGQQLATWETWVDMIVPIWSSIAIGSLASLALTGEATEMFEEIAYEALTDLGFITGASLVSSGLKTPIGFTSINSNSDPVFDSSISTDGYQTVLPRDISFQIEKPLSKGDSLVSNKSYVNVDVAGMGLTTLDSVFVFDVKQLGENENSLWSSDDIWNRTNNSITYPWKLYTASDSSFDLTDGSFPMIFTGNTNNSITITKNGKVVKTYSHRLSDVSWHEFFPLNRMKRMIFEPIKKQAEKILSIATLITFSGDVYKMTMVSDLTSNAVVYDRPIHNMYIPMPVGSIVQEVSSSVRITVASNIDLITIEPYEPIRTDFNIINVNDFSVPSIPEIPLTTVDGLPVTVTPSPTGDLVFTNPQGQPVPEADIVVNDFPVNTPNSQPGIGNPIGGGGFETGDPTKINWPKLKMIGTAFTTAFPFSLPWDVKNALDSAFGSVDQLDKVQFNWKIGGATIPISIPEYFMNWFKYIRGFVLLGFDVALIYAIRKWFGGAT